MDYLCLKNICKQIYVARIWKRAICWKKIIQLKKCRKQQILAKSTSNIFNQDGFSALLYSSAFKIIKQA